MRGGYSPDLSGTFIADLAGRIIRDDVFLILGDNPIPDRRTIRILCLAEKSHTIGEEKV
jgi:hypothetical protein